MSSALRPRLASFTHDARREPEPIEIFHGVVTAYLHQRLCAASEE
jgi:hypothetical protein